MRILLTLATLALCGCASTVQKNAGAFLNTVASYDIDASKVEQKTTGPFYNHRETVAALTHSAGHFSAEDLYAELNIPFPVFGIPLLHWELGASHISGTKRSEVAQVTK